jgi:acyl carrier protein
MDAQGNKLDPDLLQMIAAHSYRPIDRLYPHTHPVFDLGIDGDDVTELVEEIERRFHFHATDAEWRSVSSLADINSLVGRLRGQQRPEVAAERERNADIIGRRNRVVTAALLTWLGLGVISYFAHRPTFVGWVAASVGALLVFKAGETYRAIRARLRWKKERRARYGV